MRVMSTVSPRMSRTSVRAEGTVRLKGDPRRSAQFRNAAGVVVGALVWLCGPGGDAFLGAEVSLRDDTIRRRVGLTG